MPEIVDATKTTNTTNDNQIRVEQVNTPATLSKTNNTNNSDVASQTSDVVNKAVADQEAQDVAEPTCDWEEDPIACLFQTIINILGTLIETFKKYATDIAEILVGSLLGVAVARFGRTMFRRVSGLISL